MAKVHVGNVSIFTLNDAIGLPETWERQWSNGHTVKEPDFSSVSLSKRSKHPIADRVSVVEEAGHEQEDIPEISFKFYACGIVPQYITTDELETQLAEQLRVVQSAHDGYATCEGTPLYNTTYEATGLRFKPFDAFTDLVHLNDESMCWSCEEDYTDLFKKYTTLEKGQIKVLLCNSATQLGLATFPWEHDFSGIWIDYRTLPGGMAAKYNLGKTLVHESSHFMGLYHTFENQCVDTSDKVSDTNKEEFPFFGCPTQMRSTCEEGEGAPPDPVHNFLDYTDDACMCTYTPLQRSRMRQYVKDFLFQPDAEAPDLGLTPL
jgi:hypothetical protein